MALGRLRGRRRVSTHASRSSAQPAMRPSALVTAAAAGTASRRCRRARLARSRSHGWSRSLTGRARCSMQPEQKHGASRSFECPQPSGESVAARDKSDRSQGSTPPPVERTGGDGQAGRADAVAPQRASATISSGASTPHEQVEGCLDCPHPDYCAGMGKCEIGAAKIGARAPRWFWASLAIFLFLCGLLARVPL